MYFVYMTRFSHAESHNIATIACGMAGMLHPGPPQHVSSAYKNTSDSMQPDMSANAY